MSQYFDKKRRWMPHPPPLCHQQDEKNKNISFISHSSTIISWGDTCFKDTRTFFFFSRSTKSTAPREASSPWSPERVLTLAQPKFLGNHRRALIHPLGHSWFWSTEAADEQHMSLWSQISSKTDVERKILFCTKGFADSFSDFTLQAKKWNLAQIIGRTFLDAKVD